MSGNMTRLILFESHLISCGLLVYAVVHPSQAVAKNEEASDHRSNRQGLLQLRSHGVLVGDLMFSAIHSAHSHKRSVRGFPCTSTFST